jgi:hypothetical protein
MPLHGDERHELVAIQDLAMLVGDDETVGVAVERDAQIGAMRHDLPLHRRRGGGAAIAIDVEAVGIDTDRDDVGA